MLNTSGVGIKSLESGIREAFPETTTGKPFPDLDLGGATDAGLVPHLFQTFAIEQTEASIESFYSCYLNHLEIDLKQAVVESRAIALQGVQELIEIFKHEPDGYLGLLTGNIKRGARIKVDALGFDWADFPIGAFGDDHADRNQLGPIAQQRANQHYGRNFSAENIYILGDTTKDIACARALGAKAIAVATGAHSFDHLSKHKPDLLFRDFSEPSAVAEAICNAK